MFKSSKKYWVLALLCGLAASFLSYWYIRDVKARYLPGNLVKVVKAREDIPSDTLIKQEQLKIEEIPSQFAHPDSYHEKKDIVGKITITDISAEEAIIKPKLLSVADKGKRLSYSVPRSKRAVSIPVDSISGVSGYIKPEDRIDIIATIDIPTVDSSGTEKARAYSVVVLQDIQVLAIGENLESSGGKNPVTGKTITLALTLSEAQALILASERGNLRLALRSPVDESQSVLAPYQLKDFLQ